MPIILGLADPYFEGGAFMGRKTASVGFLTALVRSGGVDRFDFFLEGTRQIEELGAALAVHFPEETATGRFRLRQALELKAALQADELHAFHLADPFYRPGGFAALRNRFSPKLFPITAAVHSLSRAEYAGDFLRLLWAGTSPRDVIVATSRAARDVVLARFARLREALSPGLDRFVDPGVEIIPLGVDPQAFQPVSPEGKRDAKKRLGLDPDRMAILCFGRFSHALKMDLLPLFAALRRLFHDRPDLKSTLQLVLAGGADPDYADTLERFYDYAARIGLSLVVAANPPESRPFFEAADLFVSPSDNVQESFGLTLLEAGAAALPVVAADWNGYRDIVTEGRTGFLVPTLASPESAEVDALALILADSRYHLPLGQATALDVAALAAALTRLLDSPELRRTLGEAARAGVLDRFTWDAVAAKHLALWDRLWTIPLPPDAEAFLRKAVHHASPDFAKTFAGHPSVAEPLATIVRRSRVGRAFSEGKEGAVVYAGLDGFIDPANLRLVLHLARKPRAVGPLAEDLSLRLGLTRETGLRHVFWALKHDFLERDPDTVC